MSGAERDRQGVPPILEAKNHSAPFMFWRENPLREARRQKSLPKESVPAFRVLDPDGDLVRWLRRESRASAHAGSGCCHAGLYTFEHGGERFGIVGYYRGGKGSVNLGSCFLP